MSVLIYLGIVFVMSSPLTMLVIGYFYCFRSAIASSVRMTHEVCRSCERTELNSALISKKFHEILDAESNHAESRSAILFLIYTAAVLFIGIETSFFEHRIGPTMILCTCGFVVFILVQQTIVSYLTKAKNAEFRFGIIKSCTPQPGSCEMSLDFVDYGDNGEKFSIYMTRSDMDVFEEIMQGANDPEIPVGVLVAYRYIYLVSCSGQCLVLPCRAYTRAMHVKDTANNKPNLRGQRPF